MSVHISSRVYRAKFGSATRKAVALKLADCAHDDGTRIFPAVQTIAAEAEVNKRTVQRVLRAFVREGLLVVVRQGGRGPRDTTEYRFDLSKLDALPRSKNDVASHSFATEMIVRNQVDVKTTAKLGGWRSESLLLKRYAHPEGSRKVVEDVFGGTKEDGPRDAKRPDTNSDTNIAPLTKKARNARD